MSVKLTLKGFDTYIKQLRDFGVNVKEVSKDALNKSARMFNDELLRQVDASPMSQETKDAMKEDLIEPKVNHVSDMLVIADAGFRIGEDYHNKNLDHDENRLSGGFIALFNEYGTNYRSTKRGEFRGDLDKMEFTARAHKASGVKIRKLQKGILEKAMKEAMK